MFRGVRSCQGTEMRWIGQWKSPLPEAGIWPSHAYPFGTEKIWEVHTTDAPPPGTNLCSNDVAGMHSCRFFADNVYIGFREIGMPSKFMSRVEHGHPPRVHEMEEVQTTDRLPPDTNPCSNEVPSSQNWKTVADKVYIGLRGRRMPSKFVFSAQSPLSFWTAEDIRTTLYRYTSPTHQSM